ncbi:24-hydroxycholesterol 7-alpha-hydroxylase, partial [Geodia barretti]
MEVFLTIVLGSVAGLVGLLCFLKLRRASELRFPPERSGWIPWLGCAVPFGKAPLHFIQETREMLGDVFTIHVTGRRMTFVARHGDFKASFFQNGSTSFQAAVQPFTMKAAGLSTASFFKYHSSIHDAVKAKLVPSYIAKLCPKLCRDLYGSFRKLGDDGEMDLMSFVRRTMFDSVVRQLFGADNVPETETGMRELERKFVKFDEDFEYGTQLPEFLIRDWSECKYWLLSFFKKMVEKLRGSTIRGGNDQLMIEKLMETVDPASAHNYALLFLWASQANAIPVVFWCLGHILSSPDLYRVLQNDVLNIDF